MEMARAISDEELQLRKRARRRLIGAVVIVTAVVVALPMVLDNEPKPTTQDIDIRIPSPDSAGPFTSKVVPVPDSPSAAEPPAKPAPAPGADTKIVPTPPAQASAPRKPEAPAVAEGAAKSAPATKPDKTAPAAKTEPPSGKAAPASGQFVVQVIALSDADKAKQVQQAVLKTGVSSYTEVVKTARGDVIRVRAGPFATREAAEKAQQKLKSAGFDGKVVPTR